MSCLQLFPHRPQRLGIVWNEQDVNRREDCSYDSFIISGKGNRNPGQVDDWSSKCTLSSASPQGKAGDADASTRVSLHQTNSLTLGSNMPSHQIAFHVFLLNFEVHSFFILKRSRSFHPWRPSQPSLFCSHHSTQIHLVQSPRWCFSFFF